MYFPLELCRFLNCERIEIESSYSEDKYTARLLEVNGKFENILHERLIELTFAVNCRDKQYWTVFTTGVTVKITESIRKKLWSNEDSFEQDNELTIFKLSPSSQSSRGSSISK
jgi:hypothetical protein